MPRPVATPVRVGFLGTPHGLTRSQSATLFVLLQKLGAEEIHFGDLIGDDQEFSVIARRFPSVIKIHPHIEVADEKGVQRRTRAFLQQSATEVSSVEQRSEAVRSIVDSSTVMLFAPTEDHERKCEVWSTISYARKRNKTIYIVLPTGRFMR